MNAVIEYIKKLEGLKEEVNTFKTPEEREAFDRGFRLVATAVYNHFNVKGVK